jgi:hypothetical protein
MGIDVVKYGIEGSITVLILVIAYKIYKMKITTHSGCCGEKVIIDTQNSGGETRDFRPEP